MVSIPVATQKERAKSPRPKGDRDGQFVTLASGYAEDGDTLPIRTDARVVAATLRAGETAEYRLGADRRVRVNARDGAAVSEVELVQVTAIEDSEEVLVDAA